MFRLKSYKPTDKKANFYIQCKGEHSGRPLKNPIPNCFSVYTDCENLESLVYVLFVGGLFKNFIIGSVVPFIRIDDTKKLIRDNLNANNNIDLFIKISSIDKLKENITQQLKLLDQLQRALCFKALQQK